MRSAFCQIRTIRSSRWTTHADLQLIVAIPAALRSSHHYPAIPWRQEVLFKLRSARSRRTVSLRGSDVSLEYERQIGLGYALATFDLYRHISI